MPKKIRLIINSVFSVMLLWLLFLKLDRMFSHWIELSQRWGFAEEPPSMWALLMVFGIYPMMLITALSVWLSGAAPIVLSAVGTVGSFAIYFFELFITALYEAHNDSTYVGFDPLVSAMTNVIAFFMLAISIAEVIIKRKNKLKGRTI